MLLSEKGALTRTLLYIVYSGLVYMALQPLPMCMPPGRMPDDDAKIQRNGETTKEKVEKLGKISKEAWRRGVALFVGSLRIWGFKDSKDVDIF